MLGASAAAVLSGWVALAVVEGQQTAVTVSKYGFELSCPTSVAEGSTLNCTLTNTTDAANDWPVVAILHLSTDADRALVVGAPIDVSFGTLTGSPAIDRSVWWIGDTLVGYSRFDWTGQAPASTTDDDTDARTVSIAATDDTAWEAAEAFYVTLGPNSSKGVGFLYDNRQKVSVPQSDSKSTDATLSTIEVTAGGTVTKLSPPPATRAISVGYQTTELTVKPAATYKPSKIEVTATFGGSQTQSFEVADGEESESVFLAVGDTSVSVTATAENGTSTQAYQLTVTRAAIVGTDVTVSTDKFSLVCPSSVREGETLVCRLTNTTSASAPWPVVAFLHSSADASRALIAEDPIIPDSDPAYSRDLSLKDPQTPAAANYHFGYGELFSGGSRSVYATYGYEKFDWAGSAAARAYRDVRVDTVTDTLTEPTETFYVAIAASGYTGLSSLVDNRAPIQLTRGVPSVSGPASPSVAENSTAVATYTAARFGDGTPVLSLSGADAGLFSLSGGVLAFTTARDYESPGDADTDNTYAVTVTATLADVTASVDVTVAVTNLNDEDPVVSGPASPSVAENSAAVATYSATDPDGVTTFTWSLKDADDDDLFAIDTSTGVLTFGSAPDFEAPGDLGGDNVYDVTVEASDGLNTGEHDVAVTVTGVDEPPVVSGLDSKSFAENGTGVVASYSAIDPEGEAVSWPSLGGVDAALFQIAANGDLSFRSPPDFEAPGDVGGDNVYDVTVRASDSSSPANTGGRDVAVTVTRVDEPPVVSGPASRSFAENGTGMVAAFEAKDPERENISWSLGGVDAALFQIAETGDITVRGDLSFRSPPDFEAPGDVGGDNVYDVTVEASDGSNSGEHDVAVTVTGVDEPPVVSGPASRSFAENGTGVVASYSVIDPEGEVVSWASLGGVDAALFQIAANGDLSFRSPPDHETRRDVGRDNVYDVTVRASDSSSPAKTGGRDVAVTVTGVDEPPVVSGLDSKSFAENGTGVVASYSAIDPEGEVVSWPSLGGVDAALFQIAANGDLSFRSAPDFEAPGDVGGDNVYDVTVRASDSSSPVNTGVRDVVVTVTGVDEPPVVSGLDSRSFAENGTGVVASYSAIDPEGEAVSWASLGGVDAALFQIAANGDLSFRSPPDHETRRDVGRDNVYDVTVRASDSSSPVNTGVRDVAVTVTGVDEPPVVSGLDSKSFAENGTGVVAAFTAKDPEGQTTLIWSLWGLDRDRFTINGGRLRFGAPPDYEAAADSDSDNVYNVTVRASDGGKTGEHAVAVTVTNEEERGSLELSSPQPQVSTELTATLADPDGVVSETWRWERSPNSSAWTLISGASSGRYTPVTDDFGQFLRVTVDYTDGYTPDPDKDLVATSGFATQVTPGLNNAPEFASARVARSVLENAAARDVVGAAVVANDLEGDPLVYSLTVSGVDPAPFTIDRLTGQIRVAERATLNHESRPSLTATVTATDPSRASGSIFVDIMIDGVNEAPMTVPDEAVTQEDTAVIIDVKANDSDPEGDDLTVTVSSEPRYGTATVEADGTVLYTPGIDYHGIETFAYEVSDGHFEVDGAVSVTVHPVNDAPVFAAADTARTVLAGAAANAPVGSPVTASDVDDATLSYALEGIDASLFDIKEDTGQITVAEGAVLVAGDQHTVTVQARDSAGETGRTEVTISVTERVTPPITGGGGGGGGGPAPPQSAGFTDVDPSGVHATNIEAMFAAGITVGCGREPPRRFCPDQPVTRAQMATFLARALNPEAPSGSAGFADVDPSGVHTANIEALFAAGITVGCGREPPRFCPGQPVTRAQMATFLARALNPEAPSGSAGFADVDPSGVHTANIEALFAAGITVGCGREPPRRFCPDQPVTRAQMATFLARALNLEAPS